MRGKKSKIKQAQETQETSKAAAKRKLSDDKVSDTDKSEDKNANTKKVKIDLTKDEQIDLTQEDDIEAVNGSVNAKDEDKEELEAMIDTSEKTEFQKKCLKLLIQIPEGHFSTYGKLGGLTVFRDYAGS